MALIPLKEILKAKIPKIVPEDVIEETAIKKTIAAFLAKNLKNKSAGQARVIFISSAKIIIGCQNAAVASLLASKKSELEHKLQKQNPKTAARKIAVIIQ